MTRAIPLLLLALGPPSAKAELSRPPATKNVGVDEHRGQNIPLDLEFSDTSGHTVPLARFFQHHRPVLLVLAYSNCPMLCSLVLRGVAALAEALDDGVQLITVSIDPSETLSEARHKQDILLELANARDREAWPYLRGPRRSVQRLAGALGFRYAKDPRSGQYAHPAVVFVLTPQGTISDYLYGLRHDPKVARAALTRARAGNVSPGSDSLVATVLSCFRFDPASRAYGWLIVGLLKGGGLLLLACLGTGGYLLIRKSRSRA